MIARRTSARRSARTRRNTGSAPRSSTIELQEKGYEAAKKAYFDHGARSLAAAKKTVSAAFWTSDSAGAKAFRKGFLDTWRLVERAAGLGKYRDSVLESSDILWRFNPKKKRLSVAIQAPGRSAQPLGPYGPFTSYARPQWTAFVMDHNGNPVETRGFATEAEARAFKSSIERARNNPVKPLTVIYGLDATRKTSPWFYLAPGTKGRPVYAASEAALKQKARREYAARSVRFLFDPNAAQKISYIPILHANPRKSKFEVYRRGREYFAATPTHVVKEDTPADLLAAAIRSFSSADAVRIRMLIAHAERTGWTTKGEVSAAERMRRARAGWDRHKRVVRYV